MKRQTVFFAILLFVFCAPVAMAQSQPDNSYTFYDLQAGGSYLVPCFFGYNTHDFATSIVNPNDEAIEIDMILTHTGAEGFEYWAEATYGSSDGNVFTYSLPAIPAKGSLAINVITLALQLGTAEFFSGHVEISSPNGDFYVFPPNDFTVVNPGCGHANFTAAYHSAWQTGTWTVPWFYDGWEQMLISPYANHWHNDSFWPEGWNTEITVLNQDTQNTEYTLTYVPHVWGSALQSFDPNSSCAANNLNDQDSKSVDGLDSWVLNLRDDILNPPSNHAVRQDGWIYITLDPLIPYTGPSSTVVPVSGYQSNSC